MLQVAEVHHPAASFQPVIGLGKFLHQAHQTFHGKPGFFQILQHLGAGIGENLIFLPQGQLAGISHRLDGLFQGFVREGFGKVQSAKVHPGMVVKLIPAPAAFQLPQLPDCGLQKGQGLLAAIQACSQLNAPLYGGPVEAYDSKKLPHQVLPPGGFCRILPHRDFPAALVQPGGGI